MRSKATLRQIFSWKILPFPRMRIENSNRAEDSSFQHSYDRAFSFESTGSEATEMP